jgi:hypothetical protein
VAIVVDANLMAAAANHEPAGAAVIERLARWFEAGEELPISVDLAPEGLRPRAYADRLASATVLREGDRLSARGACARRLRRSMHAAR